MRLLVSVFTVLVLLAQPASAAKVTWRGNMCVTGFSAACPAGDWVLACYAMAFRPPNVGQNGAQTLFAFGDDTFRYGMRLASGSLIGTTYKAVSQTAVTTFGMTPGNVMMRFTAQTPASMTASTPSVYMTGNINNIDGYAGCNISFRASGVLAP